MASEPFDQKQQTGDIDVSGDYNVITFNQTQIIQVLASEVKTRPFIAKSPYKGLEKFDLDDKDYFFGRDQFLTGLVNELEQTNLILLLGASGSGKSSVIRAGLIPWLSLNREQFFNLTFTPDQDPFESLYGSLLGSYKQADAKIAREGNANTLVNVVSRLKQPNSYWLILIDQFEELFTTSQPAKRDVFIESLIRLQKQKDRSVKIIATMRADFLDRLSPYPALVDATDNHRPIIAEMHLDELRLAIEQPVAHHGVTFEEGLVEEIIHDVRGQAGYLPLLQYSLKLLWEKESKTINLQQERTLKAITYRELGGIRGALQQHIDQLYENFSPEERLAVQRIFLRLVGIGGDENSETEWKPIRRRANLNEFDNELEQHVLTQLVDEKLLISDRQLSTQQSTVELAHEVLLTSWMKLNHWINENRQAIALRNRLNDDVVRWQIKKAEDELWSGSKLEQALELRQNLIFTQVLGGFSTVANQFIDISVGKRNRTRRRIFWSVIVVVSILSTSTALAIRFAIAEKERTNDAIEALIARPRQLLEANNQLEALLDSVLVLQKLDKIGGQNREALHELESVINQISERNRLEGHEEPVVGVEFSHDGQKIASGSYDGFVKIWDSNGKLLKTWLGHHDVVWNVKFNPTNSMQVASVSGDGTARIWNLSGNQTKSEILKHDAPVHGLSFSPNGTQLATSSNNNILVWDVSRGQRIRSCTDTDIKDGGVEEIEIPINFSPDGTILASTGYKDGTVKILNLKTCQFTVLEGDNKPLDADPSKNIISSVQFNPNPKYPILAASSYDGTIKFWNIKSGKLILNIRASDTYIYDIAFSPDGTMLASASRDKTIKLWNLQGNLLKILKGHTFDVNGVNFDPNTKNGLIIASASDDRTVRLWRVDSNIFHATQSRQLIEEICGDIQGYLETHRNLNELCSR